jgi:hypothetical protein
MTSVSPAASAVLDGPVQADVAGRVELALPVDQDGGAFRGIENGVTPLGPLARRVGVEPRPEPVAERALAASLTSAGRGTRSGP